MSKGKNAFFDDDAMDIEIKTDHKADMFAQDVSVPKVEAKSAKVAAFYIEPSLKDRMVNYAEANDIKQSVLLRAAIQEFLDKRGM